MGSTRPTSCEHQRTIDKHDNYEVHVWVQMCSETRASTLARRLTWRGPSSPAGPDGKSPVARPRAMGKTCPAHRERGHATPSQDRMHASPRACEHDLERRPAHLRRPQQRHRHFYPSARRASGVGLPALRSVAGRGVVARMAPTASPSAYELQAEKSRLPLPTPPDSESGAGRRSGHSTPSQGRMHASPRACEHDLERRPAHLRRPQQRHGHLYPSASRASGVGLPAFRSIAGRRLSFARHSDALQPTRPLLLSAQTADEEIQTHQPYRPPMQTPPRHAFNLD